jgi:hypothetical protein
MYIRGFLGITDYIIQSGTLSLTKQDQFGDRLGELGTTHLTHPTAERKQT